jgi:predicted kinase
MYAIHYFIEKEDALKFAKVEEMPTLYIMIGMPGAGKSTLAAKLDAEVYSSDTIRKELTGDVSGETKGAIEFRLMNLRTQQALRAGLNAVSDATALSKKSRHACMSNVEGIPHKTVGLFFNCLREDTDKRNWNPDRDKNVPDDALERLWGTLEEPTMDEGFDELYDIIVV